MIRAKYQFYSAKGHYPYSYVIKSLIVLLLQQWFLNGVFKSPFPFIEFHLNLAMDILDKRIQELSACHF